MAHITMFILLTAGLASTTMSTTPFEPFCTNCTALLGGEYATTCSEAFTILEQNKVTCDDIRKSECNCCGFCNADAQYPDYSKCNNPDDDYCNFCTQSIYAEQPMFIDACPNQPKDWLAGLLLSLFLGFFGAGYLYYGHIALGVVMVLLFPIVFIVGVVLLCKRVMAGGVPVCITACGLAIWGLVVCILIGINQLLPAANEYEVYCPLTCYATK